MFIPMFTSTYMLFCTTQYVLLRLILKVMRGVCLPFQILKPLKTNKNNTDLQKRYYTIEHR